MKRGLRSLLILLLPIIFTLAGCGGGGGTSATSSGVVSQEAFTDSNGVAQFTLSNGQIIQQKVVDLHTNNPIVGSKVIMFVNGNGDSTIMVFDPNSKYAPTVNSYGQVLNAVSLQNAKTNVKAVVAPLSFTVGLVEYQEARLKKDSLSTGPTVPLTQSKLPEGIDVAFLNKYGHYLYTTTLSELSNITPSTIFTGAKQELVDMRGELQDVATTILLDSKIKIANVTGQISENINPVLEVSEAALKAQLTGSYLGNILRFKLLGYPPDTRIDVYSIAPIDLGLSNKQAFVRVMVPATDTPSFVNGFGSIFGQVTDTQGQPIPFAKINISSFDSPPSFGPLDYLSGANLSINKSGYPLNSS